MTLDKLAYELMIEHELLAREVADVKIQIIEIFRDCEICGTPKMTLHRALERLDDLRAEQAKVSYFEIARKFEVPRTTIANLFQRGR